MPEYGIQNEDSNIRVHVGPVSRRLYIFTRQEGYNAVLREAGLEAMATQPGVDGQITGRGRAVPIKDIKGLREVHLPDDDVWARFPISRDMDTTEKGRRAQAIYDDVRRRGLLPLPALNATGPTARGPDSIEEAPRVEVKCDYPAGPQSILACTGRLFLQTWEINPRRLH